MALTYQTLSQLAKITEMNDDDLIEISKAIGDERWQSKALEWKKFMQHVIDAFPVNNDAVDLEPEIIPDPEEECLWIRTKKVYVEKDENGHLRTAVSEEYGEWESVSLSDFVPEVSTNEEDIVDCVGASTTAINGQTVVTKIWPSTSPYGLKINENNQIEFAAYPNA